MLIIFFGTRSRVCREDTGKFTCPHCNSETGFTLVRTYSYFHIYWIPLFRQGVLAEHVQCASCRRNFPVAVLASSATQVDSPFAAGAASGDSLAECLGNIVSLTEAAAQELRDRITKGGFDSEVVVRITPDNAHSAVYSIAFDYATADGRDWLGLSQGLPIAIDRRDAPALHGKCIDFRNGVFCDA